jgi:hypothetical protein
VLVAGDDTAAALIRRVKPPLVVVAGIGGTVAATDGCGLLPGTPLVSATGTTVKCRPWADVFREGKEGFQPDVAVLMAGTPDLADRRIDGRVVRAGSPELATMLRRELARARRILSGDGTPLLLVTMACGAPDTFFNTEWSSTRSDPRRVEWLNSIWRQFAADHPADVRIAELGPVLCPGSDPTSRARAARLRPDGVTLSDPGVGLVWLWLAPKATELAHP